MSNIPFINSSPSGIGAGASAIGAATSVEETDLVISATPENVLYLLRHFYMKYPIQKNYTFDNHYENVLTYSQK